MGCPSTCQGYELTGDLDFDTNGNGRADSGDTYWNGGDGWNPIGTYAGILEGNQHEIKNLYINRTYPGTGAVGLFREVLHSGPPAEIRNLYLNNVNVTGASSGSGSITVGGLVGNSTNGPVITDSYVSGSITARHTGGGSNTAYARRIHRQQPRLNHTKELLRGDGDGDGHRLQQRRSRRAGGLEPLWRRRGQLRHGRRERQRRRRRHRGEDWWA